ncbi:MAG TPA: HAMP domain-containing histidine kinase [Candidatus Fraserbacteria bacterium]|nr:HAMP domain-containing histidine kinase [Candidatus Fraserbacteria bacterium]
MKRWPKLSLRYKFILTIVLFAVVLAVSFGFIAAKRLQSELEQQVLQRGYQISSNIVNKITISSLTSAQGLQGALRLYAALIPTDVGGEVLFIQIVSNGHQATIPAPLYNYLHLKPENMRYTQEVSRLRLPEGMPKPYQANTPYFDLKVAVSGPGIRFTWQPGRPFRLERVPPAYVRVGLSLAYVERVVRRELLQIAGLSALYILLGLLIAFWLYKGILGPIEVLTQAVKRFKREQTVRAEVHSGDELQTLAEEFNRMADTIAERDSRLEKINRELRQANRIKSEFLAVMGHELKTPLHAIRGYSQLLLEGVDGPLTAGQREDLASITASSDHLRELIDNILRFSKIESGSERLHPEKLEVRAVITEAIQSVKSLARAKGITIETTAPGLRLQADETKLKQILINLLANAIKYTPAGQVRISAEREGDGVRFAVSDSGIGIAPEHLGKIFEPFTQIDSSSTREWSGIGLGLAVVKKYVEMHGGQIWVKSQPGRGSVFSFSLPHALVARPAAKHEEVAALESASR